ncbi:hypothetical protein ANO14919_065380 [Xylariales sp. No.14919]|nr:hypothetical protein ANO14919_065380 [Xylariales sp. No.14919]
MCHRYIRELTIKESAYEHKMYRRTSPRPQWGSERSVESQCGESRCGKSQRKRRGVVFNVDRGDHVTAALEALRLEEFLDEQDKQGPKKLLYEWALRWWAWFLGVLGLQLGLIVFLLL